MKISGYDFPNFVIKFGKLEHLQSLQKGTVYLKNCSYYRSLEQKGQGDKLDGKYFYNTDIVIEPNSDNPIKLPALAIFDTFPEKDEPVFCATWVNDKNAKLLQVKKDHFATIRIQLDVEKIKKDFSCDYGLIFNYAEFQTKIKEYCRKNNICFDHGLVKYYDIYNDLHNPWRNHYINKNDRFFIKDIYFSYQNEIRWVVFKDVEEGKDYTTISIEPLSISKILPIQKFSNLEVGAYIKEKPNEI